MLLEAGLGDAYGCPFEYAPEPFYENNDGATMHTPPRFPDRGAGRYTDDTQMAICIARMMLDGTNWSLLNCANEFVYQFKRDPRTGYARGFVSLLLSVNNGRELLDAIRPTSDKSGAAMRAFPIGLYPNLDRVKTVADIQAQVTHNTPDGRAAAIASALCVHYFAYGLGPRGGLPAFIKEHTPPINGPAWDEPYVGVVGEKGWMSVQAAITAIAENDGLADILRASIAFKGDVDTVATISMGAASFCQTIRHDLPRSLYDGLENHVFGRDYLEWTDRQLLLKFSPLF
jgi:ADP-ribosyl-[dinitrogen reductase] hydrolase